MPSKGLREVMGATNPANAAEGTIRKRFATNIERNCIHGSDAPETAEVELRFLLQHGGIAVRRRRKPEVGLTGESACPTLLPWGRRFRLPTDSCTASD